MPKAREIAAEFRKWADALDMDPQLQVNQPYISITADDKDTFVRLAKIFPRPFYKDQNGNDLILRNLPKGANGYMDWDANPLNFRVKVTQETVCRIIKPAQPAEYECDPILSLDAIETTI